MIEEMALCQHEFDLEFFPEENVSILCLCINDFAECFSMD